MNEVKTSLAVSFSGYVIYRNYAKVSAERGGTVLLVKNYISKYVTSVDTSVEDQVSMDLGLLCTQMVVWFLLYYTMDHLILSITLMTRLLRSRKRLRPVNARKCV